MQITRRDFEWLALGTVPAAAHGAIRSEFNSVKIGAQSYSFRDRSLDEAIQAMKDIGLGYCELWSGHVEPRGMSRVETRQWRLSVSMDEFRGVRRKFQDAGIELYAYNYSFRDDFGDEEIARGFEMAYSLGVSRLTASSTVSAAARIDPHAARAQIQVGMHNHSNLKPNEFARPEDFAEAMKGRSRFIAINLDIGHFVAAGFDPVAFLTNHHDRIVTMHIKDRKKNQGANVPFGEGDTPIREVLQLLREKRYGIPAMIEYEYKGEDTVAEVRKCFAYCKQAVTSSAPAGRG